MRDAVGSFFEQLEVPAEWEVRVQLCTDLATMPIEDASVAWPEDVSPFIAVARITVTRQMALSPERLHTADDNLAFSPWHGVAAHRPLGSVMRVRKAVYEGSVNFRGQRNGCPMHEPRDMGAFVANP